MEYHHKNIAIKAIFVAIALHQVLQINGFLQSSSAFVTKSAFLPLTRKSDPIIPIIVSSPTLLKSSNTKSNNEDYSLSPSSLVAAASAGMSSMKWHEDALDMEIPRFLDGENEYYGFGEDGGEEADDDEEEFMMLKGVTYPQEMIEEWETLNDFEEQLQEEHHDHIFPDEELCVIDEQFDIDQAPANQQQQQQRKLLSKPKKHKHLFRYSPDISVACWLATVEPEELLRSCGYTKEDLNRMREEFPKLMNMDAKNLIAPKMRFLVNVLGGGTGDIGNGLTDPISTVDTTSTTDVIDDNTRVDVDADGVGEEEEFVPHNLKVSEYARTNIPTAAFFQPRLETTMGPRHAYLAFHKDTLPYGREILESPKLLSQFLEKCTKKPGVFASLCNEWESENKAIRQGYYGSNRPRKEHTTETVMAMDNAFSDGLTQFARNEITPDLEVLGCSPSEMMQLLLDHGANYAEHDDWGSTVLHWASGTGNLQGMKKLIEKLEKDEEAIEGDLRDVLWSTCASCSITRDGATPLHWASCGVNHTHFGCGGQYDVCKYLLDKAGEKKEALANAVTATGNTPLMWASWSGSSAIAKLLVDEGGADPHAINEHGFTAAHWAASGGSLEMCQYLYELGLKFVGKGSENNDGDTPLSCAMSYGRSDISEWIANQAS